MDRERLVSELEANFGGTAMTRRAVSRQAQDLADSGQIEADMQYRLTADAVVANLADAPEEYTLVERWNWWMGSLDLAFGEYQHFHVRPDLEDTQH